ncbi:MAG: ATPase, partial [Alistipes sp.]|nr:ATPase [Candidatus Minthomonas equi]
MIADAGATKTDWRLVSSDSHPCKKITGGINLSVNRTDNDISDAYRAMAAELDISFDDVSVVWYYGAGLTSVSKCETVAGILSGIFSHAEIHVDNDLVGASRAVLGASSGIACILGTGANSCEWNGEKIIGHVNAGGYVLGDEGSGAYMGRLLLSDYIKGLVPDVIGSVLSNEYGLTYENIVNHVYRGERPSGYLASFVPLISRYSELPYCRALVSDAFDAFLSRNIFPYGRSSAKLAFVGSIAMVFREILSERVKNAGY